MSRRSTFEPANAIADILLAEDQEPDWLVRDLILQGALVCFVGESNSGKSFVSYVLGLAIATGCQAFGGIVPAGEPRRVLYFDDENSKQDRDRYLRWAWNGLTAGNGGKEPDLGLLADNFWPVHYELGINDWQDKAQKWVEWVSPHLIIFDTANASFNVEDENTNAEATKAVKSVRRLMALPEPEAAAWVLKHGKMRTEKGQGRTVRGAKVWKDLSDGMIFQVKSRGRPRKDKLHLTRIVPDKVRAFGLRDTIYITPRWSDVNKTGLVLDGSYKAGKEHKFAEVNEDRDLPSPRRN